MTTERPAISNDVRDIHIESRTTNADGIVEKTWKLLDNVISNREFRILERALATSAKARSSYLQTIQMHADLLELAGANSGS